MGRSLTVVPGEVTYADFALVAPLLWAFVIIDNTERGALKSWNNGLTTAAGGPF